MCIRLKRGSTRICVGIISKEFWNIGRLRMRCSIIPTKRNIGSQTRNIPKFLYSLDIYILSDPHEILQNLVEGSDAAGFPLLLCIDDRVNLFAERPAQFHEGVAYLIVVGLLQLGFGQYDKNVPIRTFTGLSPGTGAKQEHHTSFRRGILGHLPDLVDHVSVLVRHNITFFPYPSAKIQKKVNSEE